MYKIENIIDAYSGGQYYNIDKIMPFMDTAGLETIQFMISSRIVGLI